jgi:phosphoglycerate dehydrogenase-like enzyme
MAQKILFIEPHTPWMRENIARELPDGFDLAWVETREEEEHAAAMADAEYVILGAQRITGDMLRRAKQLRLIQKWGIGMDKIDLDTCRALGVPVAYTPGNSANAVAELMVALTLAVSRRVVFTDARLRQGEWLQNAVRQDCFSLHGKTVAILGMGRIGSWIARMLSGFECDIVYHNRNRLDPQAEADLKARYVSFDEMIETADVIEVMAPYTPENAGMIGAAEMARMKDTAILVCASRGGVIDEAALADALEAGTIAGAGLDVWAKEPVDPENRLLKLDNVVGTSHIAGSVRDILATTARHCFGNIATFAQGGTLAEGDWVVPPKG